MEEATSVKLTNHAGSEELKRFCTVMGVAQSNALYRILSAKDDAEMLERLKEETTGVLKSNRSAENRGAEKCADGQI